MTNKSPRQILVTGASRGIGRKIAEYLLAENYNVIGLSRNNSDLNHINYMHFNVDISNITELEEWLLSTKNISVMQNLYAIINNAGVASMNYFLLTPTPTIQRILNTNSVATMLICRELGKILMRNNCGRIINFSSIAVPLALDGEAVYAASKSAIETFTKCLAREFSHQHITCNCIAPSPLNTDLLKKVPVDKITAIQDKLSLYRQADYDDILNIINFFLSEKSDLISGQTITLGVV